MVTNNMLVTKPITRMIEDKGTYALVGYDVVDLIDDMLDSCNVGIKSWELVDASANGSKEWITTRCSSAELGKHMLPIEVKAKLKVETPDVYKCTKYMTMVEAVYFQYLFLIRQVVVGHIGAKSLREFVPSQVVVILMDEEYESWVENNRLATSLEELLTGYLRQVINAFHMHKKLELIPNLDEDDVKQFIALIQAVVKAFKVLYVDNVSMLDMDVEEVHYWEQRYNFINSRSGGLEARFIRQREEDEL